MEAAAPRLGSRRRIAKAEDALRDFSEMHLRRRIVTDANIQPN